MAGAPSQLDLFDYKPKLKEFDGQVAPDSDHEGQALRLHGYLCEGSAEAAGQLNREFKQYGKSGFYISSLLPNIAAIADDLSMLHGISYGELQPRARQVLS